MPRFEWHALSVWVGEMSRANALDFFVAANELNVLEDQKMLEREVDALITCHSPCKVTYKGQPLDVGKHIIAIGDEEPFTLELPLKRDQFNSLPVSLAREWTKAAEAANPMVLDFFLDLLKMVGQSISVIEHALALS